MNFLTVLTDLLLVASLILFIVGTLIFFIPSLLIKWNAIGNTWLSGERFGKQHEGAKRLFLADYAIFANHRITGGVMWGLSSLFLFIYIIYT